MSTQPLRLSDDRWNFLTMGMDMAIFTIGSQISSYDTIIPLYLASLTNATWTVTLVTAFRNIGQFLPMLFVAHYIQYLPRTLPVIRIAGFLQRLPFLLLGLLALFLAGVDHRILVTLSLFVLLIQTIATGLAVSPWFDLVTRAIPEKRISTFFGFWNSVGALLSLGGVSVGVWFIAHLQWPWNFASCFITTFIIMMISLVVLLTAREPRRSIPERPAESHFLADTLAILRKDRPFANYVLSFMIVGIGTLSAGLLTPAALHQAHLTNEQVSLETSVLIASGILGNVVCGVWGGSWHPRTKLLGTMLLQIASLVLALLAHDWLVMTAAFFLFGFMTAGGGIARAQMILRYGPVERRPVYVGIADLAVAPWTFIMPILGGILADRIGYGPLFTTDIAILGCGFIATMVLVRHDQ